MSTSATPLIVAGSYERFLFGLAAPGSGSVASATTSGAGDTNVATLERRFTYAAHQNAVKCIASSGPFLASGGGDDQIHLYDLKHGKDLGFLMNPGDGPVPCLQFFCPSTASGAPSPTPSHMFSGSQDGSIAIWQAGKQWEHLKLMKGHKGAVNALSIHPTGRLALSTSHDGSLRMWDLSKGRCTYTSKLDAEGDDVAFSPGGDTFTLTCGAKVTVHATGGEGGLVGSLQHSRRVLCGVQQHEGVLMTGTEDGCIKVWDLRSGCAQGSIERAHNTRIRGMTTVLPGGAGSCVPQQLASASSDGVVKVWDMRMMSSAVGAGQASSASKNPGGFRSALLAQARTDARLTCITTVDPVGQTHSKATPKAATAKQKEGDDDVSAEAAAIEKRKKRAAKKRARAEAKAAREAAAAANEAAGKDKEKDKGAAAKSQQQQPQQQQQWQDRRAMKAQKGPSVGNDDEFETVARESSEEGEGQQQERRVGFSGRGRSSNQGSGSRGKGRSREHSKERKREGKGDQGSGSKRSWQQGSNGSASNRGAGGDARKRQRGGSGSSRGRGR